MFRCTIAGLATVRADVVNSNTLGFGRKVQGLVER